MIEINDKRTQKEFRKISFSGYQKSEVKKELIKCLHKGDIEPSCYWGVELICAGHFIELWEIILEFISKYIHCANPKLPVYIKLRYDIFRNITYKGYIDNELRMRNNTKIRSLFAEILCILCLSRKKHCLSTIKIQKNEFQIFYLTPHLKAPKTIYASTIFRSNDPKELFIAVNELGYHLSSDSLNGHKACFWVEWIIEFSCICNKEKKNCIAERRTNIYVHQKFQNDIIWIVWELILFFSAKKGQGCRSIVESLLELFCIRFQLSSKKKRRFLIYFSILLITENINYNINVFEDKKIIENTKSQIGIIYKQIKKNESAPKTDYLFNNSFTGGKNIENTVKKLEKMDSLINIIHRTY